MKSPPDLGHVCLHNFQHQGHSLRRCHLVAKHRIRGARVPFAQMAKPHSGQTLRQFLGVCLTLSVGREGGVETTEAAFWEVEAAAWENISHGSCLLRPTSKACGLSSESCS